MAGGSAPGPPRLRRGVNLIGQAGGVQLRRGDESIVVLEGAPTRLIAEVVEALDGSQTEGQLIERFGPERAEIVRGVISELRREALLEGERADEGPRALERIDVIGHQPLIAALAEALSGAAEQVVAHDRDRLDEVPRGSSALLCAVERPDLGLLERTNALAASRATPALFVNLSHGGHATIGPFFVPGDGACYRCWHLRLLENTASYEEQVAYDEAQRTEGAPLEGAPISRGSRLLVSGLVALEVEAFSRPHAPVQTVNGALTVDLSELRVWREPCFRVPWCEVCGG